VGAVSIGTSEAESVGETASLKSVAVAGCRSWLLKKKTPPTTSAALMTTNIDCMKNPLILPMQ